LSERWLRSRCRQETDTISSARTASSAAIAKIALSPGKHILGRSNDAVIFVDSVGVSRHHARITIGEQGALIE